jgi:hypothetical protein
MTPHKTERRVSLQETMRKMSQRMDTIREQNEREAPAVSAKISNEIRAWIAVDPLLAHLHKQLVDAKAAHARLAARHGKKDAMTDVANDVVDSAQCAVDTRLIELRCDEEKKGSIAAMISAEQDAEEVGLVALERERTKKFWREFSAPHTACPAHQQGADSFFLVMASLIALRYNLDNATQNLSIASVFGHVSHDDRPFNRIAGAA